MKKFRCKICGHVVEKEELEEGFTCPLCGVSKELFEEVIEEKGEKKIYVDENDDSIQRIKERCIDCGVCKNTCENIVGIKYKEKVKGHPACLGCGQCILTCPTASLAPNYDYHEVLEEINNPEKITVVLTSPAVRVSLGEMFGPSPGTDVEKELVTALRHLGFSYVFDTTFGADLTVMEEAYELINRIEKNEHLPQFTSCCPACVQYVEIFMPELIPNLSTCKSPIGMQTTMIKTYFAKQKGYNPKNIVTVALTPCTAKKKEANRSELQKMCDYVLTASEVGLLLRERGLDIKEMEKGEYDDLMGRGSGAGIIFGNTGGVMEASLRTAYFYLTGENPPEQLLNLESVRGLDNVKEASIKIKDKTINVAVVHTIPSLKELLEKAKLENKTYHFIEVMNCRGGCIGGGGQPLTPINNIENVRKLRIEGLYKLNNSSKIKSSYENEDIKKIYKEFLGNVGSDIAHSLLHTTYSDKSILLKGKVPLI